MKSDTPLSSLSFWQKIGIIAFAPQAFCLSAFGASLHYGDGDRLSAAVYAMMLLILPLALYAMIAPFLLPAAETSLRGHIFAATATAATSAGLVALVLGFGWALVEVLYAREGHYIRGGVFAATFAGIALMAPCYLLRHAWGIGTLSAAALPLGNASLIAFTCYTGSVAFCLTLAGESAVMLLLVFRSISRNKPS